MTRKTAQEPAAGATFACHVATFAGDGRDCATRLLRGRETTIWTVPRQVPTAQTRALLAGRMEDDDGGGREPAAEQEVEPRARGGSGDGVQLLAFGGKGRPRNRKPVGWYEAVRRALGGENGEPWHEISNKELEEINAEWGEDLVTLKSAREYVSERRKQYLRKVQPLVVEGAGACSPAVSLSTGERVAVGRGPHPLGLCISVSELTPRVHPSQTS